MICIESLEPCVWHFPLLFFLMINNNYVVDSMLSFACIIAINHHYSPLRGGFISASLEMRNLKKRDLPCKINQWVSDRGSCTQLDGGQACAHHRALLPSFQKPSNLCTSVCNFSLQRFSEFCFVFSHSKSFASILCLWYLFLWSGKFLLLKQQSDKPKLTSLVCD